MVEAMASGLPVAAFPVTGPIDVVKDGKTGSLKKNLHEACQEALKTKNKEECINHAKTFSWDIMTKKFLKVQSDKKYIKCKHIHWNFTKKIFIFEICLILMINLP